MRGSDVSQNVTAAASAKQAAVHVRLSFAFPDLKLWRRPILSGSRRTMCKQSVSGG
jgi:hypothetical protein